VKPSASAIVQKKHILLSNGRLLQVGALVYRLLSSGMQVLLITSRKSKRWIVPKGWPMPGKTLSQAALQEAYEEAGVRGVVEARPFGHYIYEKSDMLEGSNGRFDVDVFAVLFSHQEKKWPERKQRTVEWVTLEEAAARVDETELKQLFLEFSHSPQAGMKSESAGTFSEA